MTEVALVDAALPALLEHEVASARRYADASRAESTRRKYLADWRDFSSWCASRGYQSLPASPAIVAVWLSAESDRGLAAPTVARKLASLGWIHRRAGLQPPHRVEGGIVLSDVLAGMRRSRKTPVGKKTAGDEDFVYDLLKSIVGDDLAAVRDRAVVAFGMASAMRRSELVALRVEDVLVRPGGIHVRIRRSKGDQEGRGVVIAVPDGRRLRPVAHLRAWLDAAKIEEGLVFRNLVSGHLGDSLSGQSIALVVKRRAAAAGYNEAAFSAHSLRSGFLTTAARHKASIWKMREVSRHKSVQVLAGYVQEGSLLQDHAGEDFL